MEYATIKNCVDIFLDNHTDFSYAGRTKVISSYIEECCNGIDYFDYISYLCNDDVSGNNYIDTVMSYFDTEILPNMIRVSKGH